MTTAEKKLVAQLLRMASSEYSNHGCNDFKLDGFTPEEKAELAAVYNQTLKADDPTAGETKPDGWFLDWLWMSFMAARIERE